MNRRPGVLVVMDPARTHHVLEDRDRARLGEIARLLAPEPLTELASPRALSLLAETEILLTGWGCPTLDARVLAAAPGLRLVAHAAGSVKALVAPELYAAGIEVTHAAAANAVPVAEFTLAMILLANKRVATFQQRYRQERSARPLRDLGEQAIGNYGKTVGIIGASRIGRRVIELLRPFDLAVLLHDPFVTDREAVALGTEPVALDELLRRSDVVSLHAPAVPSTAGMLDARRFALMPDGATFINTARPSLIDQEALVAELRGGRIFAVLDVSAPEPLPPESPLYDLPNVVLTPHVAGALGLERRRLGAMAVDEIERHLDGKALLYRVDPSQLDRIA